MNIARVMIAISTVVIILVLAGEYNAVGSDELAKQAVQDVDRDYEPWFNPIWSPGDKKTEILLFFFQAAAGILIISYFLDRRPEK